MKIKIRLDEYKMLLVASTQFMNNQQYLESAKLIKCIVFEFFHKKHLTKFIAAQQLRKESLSLTLTEAEIVAFDRILSDFKPKDLHDDALKNIIHPKINIACLSI